MKEFLKTYGACLFFVELFIVLGGYQLFNFRRNFLLPGAAIAFFLAVLISVLLAQGDRIEKLEDRIAALEQPDSLKNKENEP